MFSRPRFFYGLLRLARSLVAASVIAPLAIVAAGCVAHRGYTPIGTGQIASGAPVASAAPGSGALSPTVVVPGDLPDADLRIDYMIWLPRAMEVTWQVRCADATVDGVAGETFAAYRARRLAELQAERERVRRNAAAVGSLIGGAVLGQQAATVSAGGPGANAQAGVAVDGAAVGAAVGVATVSQGRALPDRAASRSDAESRSTDVELAPDDVGAGYRKGSVELAAVPAGACSMTVAPLVRAADDGAYGGATYGAVAADVADVADVAIDPALLTGSFQVSRRDDPARRRALVAARGAIELRGAVRTSLVAAGADADVEAARARNRARVEATLAAQRADAEALAAQARAETAARQAREQAALELRLQAEARARLEAQVRWDAVLATRGAVLAYLGRCGGDPHHRERLAAEARAGEALAIELTARRQRIVVDVRGRLYASLVAAGADPELRARLAEEAAARARARAEEVAAAAQARADHEAALDAAAARRAELTAQVRADLSASLVAGGARLRPPMPPPIDENPGLPPGDDAEWVGGHWIWSGVAWEWNAGRWLGGVTIAPGITVVVGGGLGAPLPQPPPGYRPPPPPPPPAPPPTYVPSRPADPPRPPVRDHRAPDASAPPPPPPAPSPARPKVRDHRDAH